MPPWNLAQRLVFLLALGVVLHISSQVILFEDPASTGWFSYAPGSEPLAPEGGAKFTPVVQFLVTAVHVGAWTGTALWLLRDRDG